MGEHKHDHSGCNHGHHVHGDGNVHVAKDKLKLAIVLSTVILLAEVVGGVVSNSLALLSDAGHMFTDVISLFIALIAIHISQRLPNKNMTYGYHRITVLAALLNALSLIGIAVFICFEAYERLLEPQEVHSGILLVVATIGLLTNIYIGLSLRDQSDNVNIKGAMLHVFGDAIASAGVIISGIIIYFTDWYIVDPILSVLIALIVAGGAFRLMKETCKVLMEGTPADISFEEVSKEIRGIEGVQGVHDLHIWSLTSNRNAMTAHVVVEGSLSVSEVQQLIKKIEDVVYVKFHIGHSTIQLEDKLHSHGDDMFSIDTNWKKD